MNRRQSLNSRLIALVLTLGCLGLGGCRDLISTKLTPFLQAPVQEDGPSRVTHSGAADTWRATPESLV